MGARFINELRCSVAFIDTSVRKADLTILLPDQNFEANATPICRSYTLKSINNQKLLLIYLAFLDSLTQATCFFVRDAV